MFFTQALFYKLPIMCIIQNMRIKQGESMETKLRKIRLEKKLTLQFVASATNCDPGNLSRIERGITAATPRLAEKLSLFFCGEISEMEIIFPEREIHAPNQHADA